MKLRIITGIGLITTLLGCASTSKQAPSSQLQMRMSQVEDQLDAQGKELDALKVSVDDLSSQARHVAFVNSRESKPDVSIKVRQIETEPQTDQNILRVAVAPEEVQRALKSAGYYLGTVDGKLGSGSIKAIKDFQADHDLVSDGIVGKRTWAELQKYLK